MATVAKSVDAPGSVGVIAAPSTYVVDGQQYVSIAVCWGGVYGKAAMPEFVKYQLDGLVAGRCREGQGFHPGHGGRHQAETLT